MKKTFQNINYLQIKYSIIMETMTIKKVNSLINGLEKTDAGFTKKPYCTTVVNGHADMIKSQIVGFFCELTDLVKIDNAYRGILL